MGIFQKLTEKSDAKKFSQKMQIKLNNELYLSLIPTVPMDLLRLGLGGKVPARKVTQDGLDFLKLWFCMHVLNKTYLRFKKEGVVIYLSSCGANAVGAGIYITNMRLVNGSPLKEFSKNEINEMFNITMCTSLYDLALSDIGIAHDSQERRKINELICDVLETYRRIVKDDVYKDENIYTFMQTLYSAGVMIALEKNLGKI